mmetsp:Transcript_60311/g.112694  ORF Transcript_60311/g.112694 Transcript_60311/m.112694 type:complete len:226 (+) Transcript_60311:218-895(+)
MRHNRCSWTLRSASISKREALDRASGPILREHPVYVGLFSPWGFPRVSQQQNHSRLGGCVHVGREHGNSLAIATACEHVPGRAPLRPGHFRRFGLGLGVYEDGREGWSLVPERSGHRTCFSCPVPQTSHPSASPGVCVGGLELGPQPREYLQCGDGSHIPVRHCVAVELRTLGLLQGLLFVLVRSMLPLLQTLFEEDPRTGAQGPGLGGRCHVGEHDSWASPSSL